MTELQEEFCNHCKMALTDDPKQRGWSKKAMPPRFVGQYHNTVTLLYKNVDVAKLEWGEVPSRRRWFELLQTGIFSLAASSGRLSFSKLKTVVEQALVESEKMDWYIVL